MMTEQSTPWAIRILRWFCPPQLLEEIEGDLLQQMEDDEVRYGILRARRRMFWNMIRYFRPGILFRREGATQSGSLSLLVINLGFAWRHVLTKRGNSVLHVTGLTMGISVCLLIYLFIKHERSFDGYHRNASDIFRVNSVFHEGGNDHELYATPVPLASAIRNSVAGVQYTTLIRPLFRTVVEPSPHRLFKEERMAIADADFFEVFDVALLHDDGQRPLSKPHQAILSQSTARKFYGVDDPIGKTIKVKGKYEYTVAAVMADPPANTSLPATILLSFADDDELMDHGDTWYFGGFQWAKLQTSVYIRLQSGFPANAVQLELDNLARLNINSDPTLSEKVKGAFELQPLRQIHFDAKHFGGGPWVAAMNDMWLWFFAAIGLIVLLLACVNFVNLATAMAVARGKEVGIRKAIGAPRGQLILQFMLEAFIMVFVSTLLALFLVAMLRDSWATLLGYELSLRGLFSLDVILSGIAAMFSISFLAGFYPAWMVSRFNPVAALRAKLAHSSPRSFFSLRRTLVVAQFLISSLLILVVLGLSHQLNYLYSKDMGFDKDGIVTVEIPNAEGGPSFADALMRLPGVKDVSLSRVVPVSNDHWWNSISTDATNDVRHSVCAIHADDRFFTLYKLKLLTGRWLAPEDFVPDSIRTEQTIQTVVVNEKLLQALQLGTPAEAVGAQFWWGGQARIVGVVADFNSEPLNYEISPTLIAQEPGLYKLVSVKLEAGTDQLATIKQMGRSWAQFYPDDVFEPRFLDAEVHKFYAVGDKLVQLFGLFGWIAILISCLGLWGLVAFSLQARVKEIGIRKVMGIPAYWLLWLLSREFVVSVGLAFILAWPLSHALLNLILRSVAFRVYPGWEVFLVAMVAVFCSVLVTVGFRILRAMTANPVDALKCE
ncbi:MAG: ABC transporter permease [Cyclobacteriaceae bacterium]